MAGKRRTKGTGTLFKKNNGRYALRYEDVDGVIKTVTLKDKSGKPITLRNEAVKAADAAKEKGIRVGIILLEMLKPYDVTAGKVSDMIPQSTKGVIFLEEEIHSGGMGVNLREKLDARGVLDGCKTAFMAVDDSFVDVRNPDEHIYKTAGIDADSICKKIIDLVG